MNENTDPGEIWGPEGDTGTDADADSAWDTGTLTVTDNPALHQLEFFQVVSIPVLRDGADVPSRNAPLVADRAAVLRATIRGPADGSTADVELVVTVQHDGTSDTYTAREALSGDGQLRVDLPAEAIDPDATYTVTLNAGAAQSDRFPAYGEAAISAEVTGPLRLHLVPFELNGFVPDTSDAVIQGYRDAVFAIYPVTDVVITVGDVVPAPSDNLGDLLVDVGIQQEQIDRPDPDVYYYGMVTGVATREAFDGTTGSSQELETRAGFAIGAAFGDQKAEDTLIHELGHLHYLVHADCGGAGAQDPAYPYAGADIGVEGYDVRSDTFVQVGAAYDMMAYCYPRWISDYHYDRLVDWVQHAQTW